MWCFSVRALGCGDQHLKATRLAQTRISVRAMAHDDDEDYEESLISQFETTLSIRPSNNDAYHEDELVDLSIDHTVYSAREHSVVDIAALEAEEALLEQIPKFKTKSLRRLSLLPTAAQRKTVDKGSAASSRRLLPIPPPAGFEKILAPSPLIDYSLTKFESLFATFLDSNPQILQELPRFTHEHDKTLVLLLPYSAEHAFGRRWVTKSYLATIFERPQRLLASCIGVALAITMFPFFYKVQNSTKRGSILSPHVRRVHGKNWPKKLYELCLESHERLEADDLEVPEDWNTGDIYLNPKTINAIEGVIGTLETAVDALFGPLTSNLAFVVIRPPGHHSHACLPSGFCLLNNVQIATEYAFATYGVTHCAILDIDLHHGDGSQDICWERSGFTGEYGKEDEDEYDDAMLRNNPRNEYGKRFATYPKVGYFSLHDVKSYPTELGFATKENIKNASTCIMDHDLNIWNVHLQEWSTEDEFYKHYQTKYVAILNRANQFLNQAKKQYEQDYDAYLVKLAAYKRQRTSLQQQQHKTSRAAAPTPVLQKPSAPPTFKPLITISAGFDALEYENPQMQRHGINVPTSFYSTFTKDVVKLAKIHTEGKVISFLEGGYSDGALTTGIFSHLIGLTNNEDGDNLWNETWGSEQVMKELVKGCKKNWAAYKKPRLDVTIWANEVIKLGRSMMPNSILPSNYVYKYKEPAEEASTMSNMVRHLYNERYNNLAGNDKPTGAEEDGRRVTRSYLKRVDS